MAQPEAEDGMNDETNHVIDDCENMEDFISQLPDDILVPIITRISVKEAVRTSILSKRWRNIYKFIPTMNFLCGQLVDYFPYQYIYAELDELSAFPPHDSKAILALHRFLQLHSGPIHSFGCKCCLTKSYAHVFEQCICSLGKLGIEKLLLAFSCKRKHSDLSFSCQLLSHMPSLKYFKLMLCSLQPNLKSQCNSLKTLTLSRVRVRPGSIECILSNCLSLNSMVFDHCEIPSKLCFRGPNLQLKTLVIRVCEGVEDIEFYASNLVAFEFYDPQIVNFKFDYVPQLKFFYLSLYSKNVMPYVRERLGKDLPHLNCLVFDTLGDFFQESSMGMVINMFSNLKQLELSLCCIHPINLLSLTPLLHNCPLLQEFHLSTRPLEYHGPQVEEHVVLHPQLKNVYLSGFGGTKNEISFALYILRSAVELQQLCISNYANKYIGFGKWVERARPPWTKETYKNILSQLKDQAISKTVQVIIQQASQRKSETIISEGDFDRVIFD